MQQKIDDMRVKRSNTGYGQSKLDAEHILFAISHLARVRVSTVRVSQVGGSRRRGQQAWADQPWISALIHTSKTLGSFPSPVAPIDWVAVDDVATILESVILQPASKAHVLKVFNIMSKPLPWSELVDAVRSLEPAAVFEVVPLPEWVDKLRRVADTSSADVIALPALRLLGFDEELGSGYKSVKYATANSQGVSGLDLALIDQELLVSWLKTWSL